MRQRLGDADKSQRGPPETRTAGAVSSLELLEGTWPAGTVISNFQPPPALQENKRCCLKSPVMALVKEWH